MRAVIWERDNPQKFVLVLRRINGNVLYRARLVSAALYRRTVNCYPLAMSDSEESKGVPQEVEEKVDQPTEKTEEGESKTTAPQKASDSSSKPSGEGELAAELPPPQPVPSATESKAAGTASTVKQDWFQTLSDIFLDIMVKGVRREDVDVRFSESTVRDPATPTGSQLGFIIWSTRYGCCLRPRFFL